MTRRADDRRISAQAPRRVASAAIVTADRNTTVSGVRASLVVILLAVLFLAGCAQLPRRNVVEGPTSTEPVLTQAPRTNGSIFQTAYTKPLFEDRRPNQIGDVLTVVLNENLAATKSSASRANREGSILFRPDITPDVLGGFLADQATDIEAENDFEGQGGSNASNTFVGRITVTVMQVLANGNLRVAGEKRIGLNQGVEYLLFSGTVNPRDIGADSTIASTRVADTRLEYYGDGYINEAQHMGWLQRALLNISPL